jgi:hypothetical protein
MTQLTTLPKFHEIVFFLVIAAYANKHFDLQRYAVWGVELISWALYPLLALLLIVTVITTGCFAYYLSRWVLIFNGPVIGSPVWYLVNVPTFLLLDIHTLPWVYEQITFFSERTNEFATGHKQDLKKIWKSINHRKSTRV